MSGHPIAFPNVLSSEIVYKGFFDLRKDHLQLPHGPESHYTILMTGADAAAVIAETEDGKLLILNEYRHPTGQWLYGCPGGRLDRGEDAIQGAQRELLEETGYRSDEWIPMGVIYPFPAVCDQKIHFLLAKNAQFVQAPTHETFELIVPLLKTKHELYQEISSGAPVDGILCTALMLRNLLS